MHSDFSIAQSVANLGRVVDLVFPVRGRCLPWDHSYALFGALCRRQTRFHERGYPVGVFAINGLPDEGALTLTERSVLRLRLPLEKVGDALGLSGARLELDGAGVILEKPVIEQARAASVLFSAWVTYRGATDEETFLAWARADLEKRGIEGRCALVRRGDDVLRRSRMIKGIRVTGFALTVSGLSPEHSAGLLGKGLGGRTHFGGGLFMPAKRDGGDAPGQAERSTRGE